MKLWSIGQDESLRLTSGHRKRHVGVCFCFLGWVCNIWKLIAQFSSVNFVDDNNIIAVMPKSWSPPGPWGIYSNETAELRKSDQAFASRLPGFFTILEVCPFVPRMMNLHNLPNSLLPKPRASHSSSSTLASSPSATQHPQHLCLLSLLSLPSAVNHLSQGLDLRFPSPSQDP